MCKYCTNEVTPDSRLAHMGVCAECAMVDEVGNRLQLELGWGSTYKRTGGGER